MELISISNRKGLKEGTDYWLLSLFVVAGIILSIKATLSLLLISLLLLFMLWILLYPSKAVYLLLFTLPLSPYIALSQYAYASYGYLLFNLTDLIILGLSVSLFLKFCLQQKPSIEYPLFKTNISILVLYLCLLIFTLLTRSTSESIFQLFYLIRYGLYLMTGFFVWRYLSVKDIEKYIMILLFGLLINSVYAVYDFIDSISQGRYLSFALTPRVSGFWGIILGAEGYHPEIGDPNNFAMYLLMSLIVNILYLFRKVPRPSGIKRKIATLSLLFGFIALHMTMSRAAIYAFWGACSFLFLFEGNRRLRMKIISSFLMLSLIGILISHYVGIDLIKLFAWRLFLETGNELTVQEGRFSLTADVAQYLLNNITEWWGHGISSSRFYIDEWFERDIIRYRSKSLYNGYLGILWDAGVIGIILWAFWVRGHFTLLSRVKKRVKDTDWLSISLKAILLGFLIGMVSTDFYRNFRLMGYFSFLMGLLLKSAYRNPLAEIVNEKRLNPQM